MSESYYPRHASITVDEICRAMAPTIQVCSKCRGLYDAHGGRKCGCAIVPVVK